MTARPNRYSWMSGTAPGWDECFGSLLDISGELARRRMNSVFEHVLARPAAEAFAQDLASVGADWAAVLGQIAASDGSAKK